MSNFKVGDWVIIIDGSDLKEESIHKLDDEKLYLVKQLYKDSVKLWQPKEDEWCWFRSVNGNSELGQYRKSYKTNDGGISYNYLLNGTNSDFNARYCEPFIGELPSFIKEKQ